VAADAVVAAAGAVPAAPAAHPPPAAAATANRIASGKRANVRALMQSCGLKARANLAWRSPTLLKLSS
jgi:hypothetical protein